MPLTASDEKVQRGIRVAGLVAFMAASGVAFLVNPHCSAEAAKACPGYAFNSSLVLRAERAAVALVILLGILTLFVRVVIIGTVPDQLGRTGIGWSQTPEAIATANEGIKELRGSLDGIRREAMKRTDEAAAEASRLIGSLIARVDDLEVASLPSAESESAEGVS